ncbi:hypothetical protein [Hwanghaeella sp.]|uniref:hypothetical protein n=1 Tax=Hwanghaeella sp. TaxID=2605943 RepID=UPI003CCBE051
MSVESNFLIKFGLHHFVSHAKGDGTSRFVVDGSEGPAMIAHAKYLIEEMYGAPSVVSVR